MQRSHKFTILGALVFVFLLYYPIGMIWVNAIDDSPEFNAESLNVEGGSHSVAMAGALIGREVNQHHWTPNDPIFMPGWALTRMPAYQRGLMAAVARFTLALSDQLARTRGSSGADEDLQKAVGLLNYPPDIWFYNPQVSRFLPTSSSQANYRSGMKALARYNERLGQGQAVFDRRADNLQSTVERIAIDLGSQSAATDEHIRDHGTFALISNADLYYYNKGKLAAYYLLMKALGQDFADVIRERQLQAVWVQAEESLKEGMQMSNFFVLNAAPNNAVIPSHLSAQGFYLLRARTQLREITDVLQK